MPRFLYALIALLVSFGAVIPARAGLIIDATFDSSITGQADAATIESTIEAAIGVFEATYTNPISVSIVFQAGGGLGESQVGFAYSQNYQAFYNDLVATNANPAAIAGLTSNGGNAVNNPVTGTSTIELKSANGRAVGIAGDAPLCNPVGSPGSLVCSGVPGGPDAVDGIISLNTNITYPPQPDNGFNYGLMSVTEHEIDEVLGLGSALGDCNDAGPNPCTSISARDPEPEDLFRYTGPGQFASLSINCANPFTQAYFSYTGATADNTAMTQFNTVCNGADWGDWKGGPTPQVQDAFGNAGAADPSYGPNEIAAMSAIGYTVATPEPGTLVLLLTSLGLFAFAGKRLSA